MKTTSTIIGALGLVALASGCAVEMNGPEETTGSNEEAISCSNDQATYSIMAGMAVAAANEMKRWLPPRDMECSGPSYNNNNPPVDVLPAGAPDGIADYPGRCIRGPVAVNKGTWTDYQWRLGLSPKAWPRCPNRNCRNMAALLRLQEDAASGMVFGGQALDAGVLRSRLQAKWEEQFVCINRPDNHTGDDCPVEYHDLAFWYKTTSNVTCNGGFDFWYHSSKQGSNPPVALAYPGQLKNMLIWAGGSNNPFLQFNNVNGDVKIDPTGGTAEGSSTTSGSCTVVSYNANLNRCGQVYSATDLTGQCCTCNGVNKTFAAGTLVDYYKCQ